MELNLKIKQEEGSSLKEEVSDWETKYLFESPLEDLFPKEVRSSERAFEILKEKLMKLSDNRWFYKNIEYVSPRDENLSLSRFHFTIYVHAISANITIEEIDEMYTKITKIIYEKFRNIGTSHFRSFDLCPSFLCHDKNEEDLITRLYIYVFPHIR